MWKKTFPNNSAFIQRNVWVSIRNLKEYNDHLWSHNGHNWCQWKHKHYIFNKKKRFWKSYAERNTIQEAISKRSEMYLHLSMWMNWYTRFLNMKFLNVIKKFNSIWHRKICNWLSYLIIASVMETSSTWKDTKVPISNFAYSGHCKNWNPL